MGSHLPKLALRDSGLLHLPDHQRVHGGVLSKIKLLKRLSYGFREVQVCLREMLPCFLTCAPKPLLHTYRHRAAGLMAGSRQPSSSSSGDGHHILVKRML